jgi:putative N6-adenine-specific DNA methylase
MAPGRRRSFGFQHWLDFDYALWYQILADAENGIQKLPAGLITGYDRDNSALKLARRNAAAAGLDGQIEFVHSVLEDFHPEGDKGVVIMNPPYGKRLGDVEKLKTLYRQIGDVMKQRCPGWTGFVLTGNLELAKHIGLKASRRFILFNGPIECRLLKYELY